MRLVITLLKEVHQDYDETGLADTGDGVNNKKYIDIADVDHTIKATANTEVPQRGEDTANVEKLSDEVYEWADEHPDVDVTNIDPRLKDHNFPWQWYHATISGKFPKEKFLDNRRLVRIADGIEYGFARSREAADADNWDTTLTLPLGNKAVKFEKP